MPTCPDGRGRPRGYDGPACQLKAEKRRRDQRHHVAMVCFYQRIVDGELPEPWWCSRAQAERLLRGEQVDLIEVLLAQ